MSLPLLTSIKRVRPAVFGRTEGCCFDPLVLMQEFLIFSGGFLQRLNPLLRTNRCWRCLRNTEMKAGSKAS